MLLIFLVCRLALAVTGQQGDDDWIDPYDMLNYDSNTKTMKKPTEPVNYQNVPTKRREHIQDSNQAELASFTNQVEELKRQIEDQKKKITALSQQPTCNPVFKRYLSRVLKEIQRVGLPSDSTDALYDAKIRLSRQAMTEIQKVLEGEDSWRTGALDNAISQILVDFKPHDYEAWKWHFEDTFGVELDTLLKMGLFVLVIIAIVCTQLWSTVSWFMQFRRLFTVCFLVSIVWNWVYLYKIAFAEHQNNIVKMDSVNEKCTGVKKIDWSDSLKEWFRGTLTLQDDPCKIYYEVLFVNPILLVPPTKAISVTITTFITEPLKHIGQGISEFLRALLKDLPITLQIPVLLTIVLSIVVCMYGSVQAAFQYGITAPLRHRRRRDPPPPELSQQAPLQRIEDRDHPAGGDAPQQAPRHRAIDGRLQRNEFRQRQPNRARPAKVVVETLRTADRPYSQDETDGERREGSSESEQTEQSLSAIESDPQTESDSENQQDTQKELTGASAGSVAHREAKANGAQSKTKPTDSFQAKIKHLKVKDNVSKDDPSRNRSQPTGRRPAQTLPRTEDCDHPAGGDVPQQALRHRANDGRLERDEFRQGRPNRAREEPAKLVLETLLTADPLYSEDETDGELREGSPESEQLEQSLSAIERDPQTESDSENQQDKQKELTGASAGSVAHREAKANAAQSKTKPTDSFQAKLKHLKVKENFTKEEPSRNRSQPAGRRPAQTDTGYVQNLEDSAEERTSRLIDT